MGNIEMGKLQTSEGGTAEQDMPGLLEIFDCHVRDLISHALFIYHQIIPIKQ